MDNSTKQTPCCMLLGVTPSSPGDHDLRGASRVLLLRSVMPSTPSETLCVLKALRIMTLPPGSPGTLWVRRNLRLMTMPSRTESGKADKSRAQHGARRPASPIRTGAGGFTPLGFGGGVSGGSTQVVRDARTDASFRAVRTNKLYRCCSGGRRGAEISK